MSAAEPLPLDPFCSAADPARYVPRAATEQALAELRAALADGPGSAVAFTGPSGIGKSLLLRVLAAELAPDYTFVCLQTTPPGADQVCESTLHALGETTPSDPVGVLALRAALLARRGRPLVLVLDSVEALAPRTLSELAELQVDSLRIVMVASEREGLDEVLAGLRPGLRRIRLAAPMSRAETEDYLQARLAAADAPSELRVRLLGMALDLWRRSRGNPQCLHAEISQVQFELWRAGAAEPRLRLLPASEPEVLGPEPSPSEPGPVLDDLEVGADLAPVPEAEPMPPSAALPLVPLEPPRSAVPRSPRTLGRGAVFALGALSGAIATAALAIALDRVRVVPPEMERVSTPIAAEAPRPVPDLPAVAAAPAAEPPAPSSAEPMPPSTSVAVVSETPPIQPEPARVAPAAARSGPVRIQVQALPWATIYVDGKLVGETPLGDLAVEPGLREFRAEMPDGRKLTKRVQVRAGIRVLFQ